VVGALSQSSTMVPSQAVNARVSTRPSPRRRSTAPVLSRLRVVLSPRPLLPRHRRRRLPLHRPLDQPLTRPRRHRHHPRQLAHKRCSLATQGPCNVLSRRVVNPGLFALLNVKLPHWYQYSSKENSSVDSKSIKIT